MHISSLPHQFWQISTIPMSTYYNARSLSVRNACKLFANCLICVPPVFAHLECISIYIHIHALIYVYANVFFMRWGM